MPSANSGCSPSSTRSEHVFALSFRFPAGRYHATPWGRNVNEADVAWPPEPWRVLRALIATYWRKGDHSRWSEGDLASLIDALAMSLPEYSLPEGAIHAHTRHYMPISGLAKDGRARTTLVFDAFLRLPMDATLVACWPDVTLDPTSFALAQDLACAMGYLGRAESWTECEALAEWQGRRNCRPASTDFDGDPVRLIAPLSPGAYSVERQRIIDERTRAVQEKAKRPLTARRATTLLTKEFTSKGRKAHTLPVRLVDALTLDTADYQDRGWSQPPAAQEVIYARAPTAAPGVVPRRFAKRRSSLMGQKLPTVARFLLAGRPLPRIEDAVKIGELMRLAALAQFGWEADEAAGGRRRPKAPSEISGRGADGKPLKDPSHSHAFWLPEDADGDGLIDHVSVYVASGITDDVRAKLDRITRLWLTSKPAEGAEADPRARKEWRLALEGFGQPVDFAGGARIFGRSRRWLSSTPFLASGHLKGTGYLGEVRRLLARRGYDSTGVEVTPVETILVGGTERRAIHFHRFRSRGREVQPDAAGTLLKIRFPEPIEGPLAIGYGSHFGLGLFTAASACGEQPEC